MVTGTSTRSAFTFNGRMWLFNDEGMTLSLATSSFVRGATWTSFTSVCAKAGNAAPKIVHTAKNSNPKEKTGEKTEGLRRILSNTTLVRSQDRMQANFSDRTTRQATRRSSS